jgi:hypothetical protein
MAETLLVPHEPEAAGPDLAAPRFAFRGAAAALQESTERELVVSGPAGTGKSLACLWKLHTLCATHPRVRALILRKTRASLTESALVTFEQHILPPGSGISDGAGRASRKTYRYPNGSEIVCGGIDKPGRIMSSEYDLIFVQEAIELQESEWDYITTRLRNDRLPFQQLLADTNPDRPQHWIRQRRDQGKLRLLESRHQDNPALHDGAGWTPRGTAYLAILDALTGPRRARLRDGKWVQAEGVVYPAFDRAVHIVAPFAVPRDWTRYWSVDFGYTNPFVCQWWAQDPDGRLYLTREVYMSRRLVEDHAAQLLTLAGVPRGADGPDWSRSAEPRPRAVICDHDAEGRATLVRHLGLGTVAAVKDVQAGIQAVAARLRPDGTGRPRLMLFEDARVELDGELVEAKRPTCTAEEFEGYVWDTGASRKAGEEPVKKDDHGLDALRYIVAWMDGKGAVVYHHTGARGKTLVEEAPPDTGWKE